MDGEGNGRKVEGIVEESVGKGSLEVRKGGKNV